MATISKTKYIYIAMSLYLMLAIMFFLQRGGEILPTIKGFVAIPTLFAAIVTANCYKDGGKMIPLALLASAAGDWAGAQGNFIMQIAFFAVAHIFYISDFAPKIKSFEWREMTFTMPFVAVMLGVLGYIMTHIESKTEFYAVGIYGAIILSMGITAMLQARPRRIYYIVAALLFILSDSLIAYGKYVEPIANGNTWVMTTYYAAQGIFTLLMLKRSTAQD